MTGSTGSDAETRKPLQFSLRFVLGVVTGVAVFCAIVKIAGEPYRMMMAVFLLLLSYLAAFGVVVCLLTLLAVVALPGDPEEKRENLREASHALLRSIVWGIIPWLLLGVVALLYNQ